MIVNTLREVERIEDGGETAWESFQKYFLAEYGDVLHRFVETHLGRFDLLKEAVVYQDWPEVIQAMRAKIEAGLARYLVRGLREARDWWGGGAEVDVYLLPSFGFFDGTVTVIDGNPVILLGVDMLPSLEPCRLLIQHEYHHALRFLAAKVHATRGFNGVACFNLQQVSVGELFCMEGLAGIFPLVVIGCINRDKFGDYLRFSSRDMDMIEAQKEKLWVELEKAWHTKGLQAAAPFFMGQGLFKGRTLPARSGYYLGYLYFASILTEQGHAFLVDLTKMPADQIIEEFPVASYIFQP